MKKYTNFSDSFLQLVFVRMISHSSANDQLGMRDWSEFSEVIMTRHSECWRHCCMYGSNELIYRPKSVKIWWLQCPVDEDVSFDLRFSC